MNSNLTIYLAKAHTDDLLRRAKKAGAVTWRSEGPLRSISAVANRAVGSVRRSTSARQEPGHATDRDVTIRFATASDELGLRRLAQLDSSAVPPPPILIADEDGETRAALSVLSANVVADPFHPTAGLVDLLRMRAAQVGMHSAAGRHEQISPTPHITLSFGQEAASP